MRSIVFLLLAVFTFASMPALAKTGDGFPTVPTKNNGQKWRIAYYEGGEYIDYQKIFTETVRGLMKLGWVEVAEIPEQQGEQTVELWKWLSSYAKSEYLEFVPDGHYSANWDDNQRGETVAELTQRLNRKGDIDLLIAMGTWAGKDFASNKHSTPTMVLSASDPLSAGIIKSVEDSGFDHVHASVDPYRYERQLRVFHEIIGFKKLGVAYEDSVNGRSYAAIEFVEKVAKDRGFEIVRCNTVSDIADTSVAEKSVVDCFHKLADQVDAIYVTVQGGVNMRSIPELAEFTWERGIPTFSQSGSEEVRLGFLVSISQAGFKYVGEFHAETFAKVFNGAFPNQLDQLFEEPPKIAINLKTAELIGFNPPVVLLGAADEIFQSIAQP
jgi:ABC-type uncharacterized transport system substrate-binding protein